MTYGLNLGLFAGSGPTIHPAKAPARRSSSRYLAWRAVDQDRRLALVDEALAAPAADEAVAA